MIDLDDIAARAVADVRAQPPTMGWVRARARRRRNVRRVTAALVTVVPLIALVAGASWLVTRDRGGGAEIVAADGSTTPGPAPTTAAPGNSARAGIDPSVVWPHLSDSGHGTLDSLLDAFTADVLGWTGTDSLYVGTADADGPQALALTNEELGRSIDVVAAPLPAGWVLVEVGRSFDATAIEPGLTVIDFRPVSVVDVRPLVEAVTVSVDIRLDDGTIVHHTSDDPTRIRVDADLESIAAVLAVFTDASGAVIDASGGTLSGGTSPAETTPVRSNTGLVVESRHVETVPAVVACNPGPSPDASVPPNRTDTITNGPVFATPTEALEDILATPAADTWPSTAYVELIEADGSITYGKPLDDGTGIAEPNAGLAIAVSVTQQSEGWTVTGWETSGC